MTVTHERLRRLTRLEEGLRHLAAELVEWDAEGEPHLPHETGIDLGAPDGDCSTVTLMIDGTALPVLPRDMPSCKCHLEVPVSEKAKAQPARPFRVALKHFREHPSDIIDQVAIGQTVELVIVDHDEFSGARSGCQPVAIVLPVTEYEKLTRLEAKVKELAQSVA